MTWRALRAMLSNLIFIWKAMGSHLSGLSILSLCLIIMFVFKNITHRAVGKGVKTDFYVSDLVNHMCNTGIICNRE